MLPVLALVLSSASILLLRRPATAWGLADVPGGRKQHQGIVPLTGGLGVFIGFLLVQPLQPVPVGELLPLYVGLVLLVACGVIDDARDMRSTVKLGVQLLVAALMVLWGKRVLNTLGTFPGVGKVQLGWLAVPVSIVAVAGLINAINMMDGLAGGSTLGVLGWLAFVASVQSQLSLLAVIVTLAAAVTGSLLFNLRHPWRQRASVFMGDAGSMALGFAIAWFVVELSQSERAVVSPVAYGWLLALPVMDTPLLGRHQGYRLGRTGVGLVVGVLVLGVLSHQLLLRESQTLVQLLVQPLQALGLLLNDQPLQARALHPGMVERFTLWQQAWQGQWLIGTGRLAPSSRCRCIITVPSTG